MSASLARVLKRSATGSIRFRTLNSVPPRHTAFRCTVLACASMRICEQSTRSDVQARAERTRRNRRQVIYVCQCHLHRKGTFDYENIQLHLHHSFTCTLQLRLFDELRSATTASEKCVLTLTCAALSSTAAFVSCPVTVLHKSRFTPRDLTCSSRTRPVSQAGGHGPEFLWHSVHAVCMVHCKHAQQQCSNLGSCFRSSSCEASSPHVDAGPAHLVGGGGCKYDDPNAVRPQD